MTRITNNETAWAYARENGFNYSRQRIGYSVYKTNWGKTLEIGHDCAKLYRPPGTTPGFDKTKADRLIEVFRYKLENSNAT